MKNLAKYIALIAIAFAALSCAKAEQEFTHDDCTISEAYIYIENGKNGWTISDQITGEINQETGEIKFPIPRKKAKLFDPAKVLVKVNVGYDVVITPGLMGVKDLSKEYEITVTCTQTGNSKTYKLLAYLARY